jgi:CBS domain-containing protein
MDAPRRTARLCVKNAPCPAVWWDDECAGEQAAEGEGVMDEPVTRLLEQKNEAIESVTPQTSVGDAISRMNERRIGSVLVMEGSRLMGIFTERDVLTRVVPARLDPDKTSVSEVMTRQPVIISPMTTVQEAMKTVTHTRCRHLPVILNGKVLGLISIGDLTRWMVRDQQRTIDDLIDYVHRV